MRPVVEIISLELPKPSLQDQRSDERRLREALSERLGESPALPLYLLRKLPEVLRGSDFKVEVILGRTERGYEVLEVFPKGKGGPVYGLGIDLGSTGIALYLVDFREKKVLREASFRNPQIPYGEDILTRLHFAERPGGLAELQEKTIEGLKSEILKLVGEKETEYLYYYAFCGNTTMTHFFLGLPTRWLYREPYIPCANAIDVLKLRESGLPGHPEALLFVFPSGGSYFGGDLISGLLFAGLHRGEAISLFVDVGTNAEIVLGNREFLLACAGAAGPALEGGVLACGMQAREGAIERIRIRKGQLELKVIGDSKPIGICGSGTIELLAELFLAGLVNPQGIFQPERWPERFREIDGELAFVLADESESGTGRPIYVTQGEIKNLIRSKGAMYTMLTVICESVGVRFKDLERFYVAGSFGNYIDPEAAITIGMLPDLPREKFVAVGNAAGAGTVKFLLEGDFEEVREIVSKLTYLEMNVENRFMQLLTGALFLPHTDLDLFPSVKAKRPGI
ncbi:Acetyl-CoA synthase corrinoid activation protein [Thermosulfurimonas dismutans]|uniref:Acetyl-CoA synthase corrinoid activation protein n=2 Tax=Thermosulfurimonas dismutans TaxID=999894 RepID=A0A179D3R3_9BACT|nr:Acetyl-CoA synthase corrinoid activation protein [Thermosulfurimonas dismutans]